jgi:RNA polymerase-binding transcription factor DksA
MTNPAPNIEELRGRLLRRRTDIIMAVALRHGALTGTASAADPNSSQHFQNPSNAAAVGEWRNVMTLHEIREINQIDDTLWRLDANDYGTPASQSRIVGSIT